MKPLLPSPRRGGVSLAPHVLAEGADEREILASVALDAAAHVEPPGLEYGQRLSDIVRGQAAGDKRFGHARPRARSVEALASAPPQARHGRVY